MTKFSEHTISLALNKLPRLATVRIELACSGFRKAISGVWTYELFGLLRS
jgi:hypothetical protein